MRKIIICFLISLVTLIFASCAFGGDDDYKTPNELAEEMQTKIMDCFMNKDTETLKSFFCEYVIGRYSLDSQIEEAFNFIDGEIVSYNEPFTSASGGSERKNYGAYTSNIITDKGTKYEISFEGWLTNDEEHDKVGVLYIKILNNTMNDTLPNDASLEERDKGRRYIGNKDA